MRPHPYLLSLLLLIASACSSSSTSSSDDDDEGESSSDLRTPRATLAVGDESFDDLSSLEITFHALSLNGPGSSFDLIEEGVDDPVTIDALAYVDTAAPFAARSLPAGEYTEISFEISVAATDTGEDDLLVLPLFDPDGDDYENVETTFPLGPRSFEVEAPAEDNQPFLFLHIDVEQSVSEGEAGSILFAPEIFLSTFLPMDVEGTVTEIDSEGGVFAIEDEAGAEYLVQPTDCTTAILGLEAALAGTSTTILFDNLAVGDVVAMDGFLGLDPGCDDPDQDAPYFHPRRVKGDLVLAGVTAVTGIVESSSSDEVELRVVESVDIGGPGGPVDGAIMAGETYTSDFSSTLLLASRGQVRNLTGTPERLQVGETLVVLARNLEVVGAGAYSGTSVLAHTRKTFLAGMLTAVEADSLTLDADGTKKGSGDDHPAIAFTEQEPGTTTVELGSDTMVALATDSRVHVGPLGGWDLDQVLDPYYDNQLQGPGMPDGQNLGMGCVDEATADVDIDAGLLCAYVDHRTGEANVWTIQNLRLEVSSDATQKYVAWYAGALACTLPMNGASDGQPCIADNTLHRERIDLGDTMASGWANYGQSGAGKFGTSILNAGARVPGATVPDDSDTAGWDDVNELLLLGIDFDADLYPFDDTADSCVGLSERVWVDLSQAQFLYFAVDPESEEVEYRYLTTYEDFKAEVIAMQAVQDSNPCGMGFRSNIGFSFTGVIDKQSLLAEGGEVVPVIRCISGQVFDGGCVPE